MKKSTILNALAGMAMVLSSVACAELPETTDNEKHISYIQKWMEVWNKKNGKDVQASARGIYVLNEDVNESGNAVEKDDYVIIEYTIRDLDGNVVKTTDRDLARKVGMTVENRDYYGPETQSTIAGLNYAGFIDGVMGMKTGSSKDFMVPSWLMSFKDYDSAEKYEKEKSDAKDAIYSVLLRDKAKDHKEYQKSIIMDALELYGMTDADTVKGTPGIWYKTLETLPEPPKEEGNGKEEDKKDEDKKDEETKQDTTYMMINYTGTLLTRNYGEGEQKVNTKVFDTTIERTAKDAGIYVSGTEYKTKKVTWGEKIEDTQMEGSSLIRGFNELAWQMKTARASRAVAIFWSDMGYGRQGSGKSIPAYSPLIFEVERVIEEKK